MLIFNKDIDNDEKTIYNLTISDLDILKKLLKSEDTTQNFAAQRQIEKLLSKHIDEFNYNIYCPHWLYESNFEDNIWFIKNKKYINKINFEDILIEDKVKLTKIPELLNIFKTWISISVSPKMNSGKILKPNTAIQLINRILTLIDAIILNSSSISLLNRKILAIDNNFFKDILINISKHGVEIGVYNYFNKVEIYLLQNISSISEEELKNFEAKYPYKKFNGEKVLNLNDYQIRKSKAYLYKKRAYKVEQSNKINVNSGYFKKLFLNSFAYKNMRFPIIEELALHPLKSRKEYDFVPVRNQNNFMSTRNIENYISSIMLLNTVFLKVEHNFKNITYQKIQISIKDIISEADEIQLGRYTTLPSEVVFKAFRDAFHYLQENLDHILASFLKILLHYKVTSNDQKFSLKEFKSGNFINLISNKSKKIGIKYWDISKDENFHNNLRKNIGLCQAYYLIYSSLSIVIGTIMARRQSEIILLDPIHSLFPHNTNPERHKNIQFYLNIKNRKTGIGGKYNINENLTLPIPCSIAVFIYKIQNFNKALINTNIVKFEDIKLINSFNKHNLKIRAINQTTYNHYLDYFCDYTQTKILNNKKLNMKRFYIRQHQLRRFFAMLFFWSKSFDGLDSLSRFLGHTNIEQLYNYISENTHGEVLLGVKARYIYENYNLSPNHELYIENIEKLEPIIKKYFHITSIDILSESDALESYSDKVDANYLVNAKSFEEKCFVLLQNHVIDLKPMFFSVSHKETELKLRNFKLILEINQE
ncbi:hypothetical protein PGJ85_016195 [Acinetobacter baumannii]|nr:hypothetical protein [Acinetobacter baumannii]